MKACGQILKLKINKSVDKISNNLFILVTLFLMNITKIMKIDLITFINICLFLYFDNNR